MWLENFLVNDFKGAVLIVTHDRYVLEAVANRILDLENGVLTEYLRKNDGVGAFTDYLEQRAERDAHAERVEQNRQNFLRREIEWLRRGPKARSTKQKARIDRAHQTIAVDAPRERGKVDLEGLETGAARLGGTVVELEDVSLELGKKKLISHLTMHLRKGERIGIIGRNGAGKTSLLRLVTKELEPTTGKVTQGRQTNVAYFDQSRSLLKEDWTVFDNVAEREGAIRTGAGQITLGDRTMELRAYLELFLFDAHAQRRKVSALSGGERARVTLALTLKHGDNVLLLDEPTNDLDIATLGALEDLLENWPGAVLVVSHDRFFLDRVATSILAFEGAGNVELYGGNWQSYFDRKAEIEAMRAPIAIREAPAVTIPAPPPAAAAAPKKKLTYA
ncbi:MAG: ABC-F family ATP-binding cassette domain-containing protein, partial [Polyangiaceae bacterium]